MERKYSLIVIGAGMTGLSTALAWAKNRDCRKEPVLVIEKEPKAGGAVTTFARKGFRFDTVQIIPGIDDLLKFFGLEDELELISYRGQYARLFLADSATQSCRIFPVASSSDRFQQDLSARFPDERKKLERFFRYGYGLLEELKYLKTEPTPAEGLKILMRCGKIIRQSGKTYRQYLDSYGFRNKTLIEILDVFSSFSGLSGNRCAALLTACAMMTTLQGSYRPLKGFIGFPQQMKKKLESLGGEIRLSTGADEILTEGFRVRGIRCGDEIIRADNIVSTADTFKTIEMLSLKENQKKGPWFRKEKKALPSPSSFTIHLGLDGRIDLKGAGFDCGYNVLTTGRSTHEKCFDYWEKGRMLMDDREFHMAVISPSAVAGGKPTLVIHVTPAPLGSWEKLREENRREYEKAKRRTAEFYIKKVEEYMIPGLRDHLELVDISTPATYARYLGTTDGANSQMLAIPSNFGMHRLPTRTPVKGLFMPQFSHGIWPCLQAGLQTVDMITGGIIMNGASRYTHKEAPLHH